MKLLTLVALVGLALPASAQSNRFYDLRFDRADLENDGVLSFDEFLGTQFGNIRWTDAMHRFNAADADGNGGISKVEFAASRGGRLGGRPSKRESFDLADGSEGSEADGYLDIAEWSRTQARARSWTVTSRVFGRMDRDNDGQLSEWEYGIRNLGTVGGSRWTLIYPWLGRLR